MKHKRDDSQFDYLAVAREAQAVQQDALANYTTGDPYKEWYFHGTSASFHAGREGFSDRENAFERDDDGIDSEERSPKDAT